MNAGSQRGGSNRVEREVLEILERAEASRPPLEQVHTSVRRQTRLTRNQFATSLPLAKWQRHLASGLGKILVALGLAIVAALTSGVSGLLSSLFAIASAISLLSLWFPARGGGDRDAPRWRGRDLRDESPPFGRGNRRPGKPRR